MSVFQRFILEIQNIGLKKSVFLLVLLGANLAAAFCMITKEKALGQKSDEFFAEAESRFGYGKAIPVQEIEAYDTQKEETFKELKTQGHVIVKSINIDSDMHIKPPQSWMRLLDNKSQPSLKQMHNNLCIKLVRRAVANMPRYQLLRKDLKPKYMLYQRKLITEKQWKMMQDAQADLGKELNFIRSEAEKLREGWSTGDQIFVEAAKVASQMHVNQMSQPQ